MDKEEKYSSYYDLLEQSKQRFKQSRPATYDGIPWYSSERDAIAWEKAHMESKPKPYEITPEDKEYLRSQIGQAWTCLLSSAGEIALSYSPNAAVVLVVGPETQRVVKVLEKIMAEIRG